MQNNTTSRRSVIKSAASGAALSGISGSAVASTVSAPPEDVENKFRSLVNEHGQYRLKGISSARNGHLFTYDYEHYSILRRIINDYDVVQVETLEFEDGYETTIVNGVESNGVETQIEGDAYSFDVTAAMRDEAKESVDSYSTQVDQESERLLSAQERNASASATTSVGRGDELNVYGADEGYKNKLGTSNPITAPSYATYETVTELVGAGVNARGLAWKAGAFAKVWKNIEIEDSGTVKIEYDGDLRGVVVGALSGYQATLKGYLKPKDSPDDAKDVKYMGIDGVFGELKVIKRDYNAENPGPDRSGSYLYKEVTPGEYEVGIKLNITSTAYAGYSSTVVNFIPSISALDSYGYCDYDEITVSYV